ncbi:MAG: polyhydroxyalkanoate synthesis repressor PhaR [Caulobacter sp.]|jgi:polyhydroxyalkanoate synthesis repressor PhaR
MSEKSEAGGDAGDRVVIKKYANRRLYNTASSSYVTLEHLADMVRSNVDFVVFDAKSGEDITRSVLTQIIFDEENRGDGKNLLPIQFLRQLISFYGNQMQAFLPSYLEMSLEHFARQQERFRSQFGTMGAAGSMGAFDEQVRQNMALFERAMKMFTPFAYGRPDEAPAAAPEAASEDSLAELKRQVEAMREQIDKLASKG